MRHPLFEITCAVLSVLAYAPSASAQGPLLPLAPPAPTMKTLDQIEPRTRIASIPTTLTQSGSYYLDANYTGIADKCGIVVAADNVTIDLNGFALIGVPSSLHGIVIFGNQINLTVKNGTIRNWGGCGISGRSEDMNTMSSNNHFHHIQLNNNGTGIETGEKAVLENIVSSNNSAGGIGLRKGSVMRDSTASGNGRSGIYIVGEGCIVENCSAFGNCVLNDPSMAYEGGIQFAISGTSSIVRHCTSSGNNSHGIHSFNNWNLIEDNVCNDNHNSGFSAAGIQLGVPTGQTTYVTGCTVQNNLISSNDVGIAAFNTPDRTTGNLIVQNRLNGNTMGFNIQGKNAYARFIDVVGQTAFTSTDPLANLIY